MSMPKCPYCGRLIGLSFDLSAFAGMCPDCAKMADKMAEDLARTTKATYEVAVPLVRAGLAHMRVLAEKLDDN